MAGAYPGACHKYDRYTDFAAVLSAFDVQDFENTDLHDKGRRRGVRLLLCARDASSDVYKKEVQAHSLVVDLNKFGKCSGLVFLNRGLRFEFSAAAVFRGVFPDMLSEGG